MKCVRHVVCVVALASLAAVSTGGCGGGGGGGGSATPASLLSGTYAYVGFSGRDGATDEGAVSWGEFIFDGIGALTGGTSTSNENGVLTGPAPAGSLTYTISAARTVRLSSGGLVGWEGTVTANGRVAVLSAIGNGTNPGTLILGRKEGTHSTASLNGLYHFAGMGYDHVGMNDVSQWGSVAFDGAGGGPASATFNRNGGVIGPGAFTFSYAVAADGTVTGDFGTLPVTGSIIAGGELVILGGGTTAGLSPGLVVLTKGTTGATNALLSGDYRLAAMIMPTVPPPEWHGITLTGTANGTGLLAFHGGLQNQDGVASAFPAGGDVAYAVGPNGLFDFAGGSYFGGISPSGAFAVFGGVTSGAPEFWFLLR